MLCSSTAHFRGNSAKQGFIKFHLLRETGKFQLNREFGLLPQTINMCGHRKNQPRNCLEKALI